MLQRQTKIEELREFLTKIYNESGREEELDNFTDDEIVELAKNLREGVPFATPVFDGATEDEMERALDLAFPDDIAKHWA